MRAWNDDMELLAGFWSAGRLHRVNLQPLKINKNTNSVGALHVLYVTCWVEDTLLISMYKKTQPWIDCHHLIAIRLAGVRRTDSTHWVTSQTHEMGNISPVTVSYDTSWQSSQLKVKLAGSYHIMECDTCGNLSLCAVTLAGNCHRVPWHSLIDNMLSEEEVLSDVATENGESTNLIEDFFPEYTWHGRHTVNAERIGREVNTRVRSAKPQLQEKDWVSTGRQQIMIVMIRCCNVPSVCGSIIHRISQFSVGIQ